MHISIVLLGVTGDLARRKIIPSVATLSQDSAHQVDLVGVSRSVPDTADIDAVIQARGGQVRTQYVQGSYTDADTLQRAVTAAGQADIIVIYLAVPPAIFQDILETTCALGDSRVHLVVEKPFGQDLESANSLLAAADRCPLTDQVHFFDHYLYKKATYLTPAQLESLAHLRGTTPEKLEVRALESLGVSNRLAYYNGIGATKDMWQHLCSLLSLYATTFGFDLAWENYVAEDYVRGQYAEYTAQLGEKSDTDTYFRATGHAEGIDLVLESGKQVGFKETAIRATYADGTVVEWNIDPTHYLRVHSGVRTLHDFDLSIDARPDHARLLAKIIEGDAARFVPGEDIRTAWETHARTVGIGGRVREYEAGAVPEFGLGR